MLSLFQVFFPSWNFFNTYNDIPCIQYQLINSEEWINLFSIPSRKWWHLFNNSQVNFIHSCNNTLLNLLNHLNDCPPEEKAEVLQKGKGFIRELVSKELKQRKLTQIKTRKVPIFEVHSFRLILFSAKERHFNLILEARFLE